MCPNYIEHFNFDKLSCMLTLHYKKNNPHGNTSFQLIGAHNKGLQKFVIHSQSVIIFGQLLDIGVHSGVRLSIYPQEVVYARVYIHRRCFLPQEPPPAAFLYWGSISCSKKWICCKTPELVVEQIQSANPRIQCRFRRPHGGIF